MAGSDQLSSVFKTLIVLLENFDQSLALSWAKTTNKLDQIGRVWIVDGAVNVDTHLVCAIDKFEMECLQKLFFSQLILHSMIFQAKDFIVRVTQLRILDQRILSIQIDF